MYTNVSALVKKKIYLLRNSLQEFAKNLRRLPLQGDGLQNNSDGCFYATQHFNFKFVRTCFL